MIFIIINCSYLIIVVRIESTSVWLCLSTLCSYSPLHQMIICYLSNLWRYSILTVTFISPVIFLPFLQKNGAGKWGHLALKDGYFVCRAWITMGLGNMLESVKINDTGMAGHGGIYGDRFLMIQATKTSDRRGAHAQYYSIFEHRLFQSRSLQIFLWWHPVTLTHFSQISF